ncbi:MAG: histidine kinase [Acidobacteriota bacterium]|nr:histidine kinase [Acidobacteriota bacterium]
MSSSFPNNSSADASRSARGNLKVYLGYAAGVGKTYQMLEEGHDLLANGVDLVVGYFEHHERPDTTALLEGLNIIPRRVIEYRGARFEEMDTEAIIRRSPQVALVDEFPHTNVPGSARAKRWEDVLYLLDHGIDVWTTMNVQHLESLNDEVYQMSGVRIRETIPDWVIQQASEVVMVDLAPRALLNRLDRGAIYHQVEKAQNARRNFFKESTLVGLREFALRETAFEVEARNTGETASAGTRREPAEANGSGPRSKQERVLVLLTPQPSTAAVIRRGKRMADYFKGECVAVAVCPRGDSRSLKAPEREALEKHLRFAHNLHVPTHVLSGSDVARELSSFAHQHGISQIYLPRPRLSVWEFPFSRGLIQRMMKLAGDIEITLVAERLPG